jgi:phage terminase large subunit-like protein
LKKANKKYIFDKKEADRYSRFFPRLLTHSKGEWAGSPLVLEGWQEQITRDIFGTKVKETGHRKIREAYIEIPRKNGKSTWMAGLAVAVLFLDDEPGAEIYVFASDVKQANIVFEIAKAMILQSPALSKKCELYKRSIVLYKDRAGVGFPVGRIEVMTSTADTKHGFSPSCVIIDELHAQPNSDLYDVMITGMGARRQPLMLLEATRVRAKGNRGQHRG